VPGKLITFRLGSSSATGVTDGAGVATAVLPLQTTPGSLRVEASFAGDAGLASSGDSNAFGLAKQPTTLDLDSGGSSVLTEASGISATLTAGGSPVGSRTVFFVLTGNGSGTTGFGFTKPVSTDASGVAALGTTPGLPHGTYSLSAYFAGTVPLNPWAPLASQQSITLADPLYLASSAGPAVVTVERLDQTITIGGVPVKKVLGTPDFAITATASSGLPVSVSVTGPCTITGLTIHVTNIGTCTINASQAGSAVYKPATASTSFRIIWPFTGFFSPVDLTALNKATAGTAIPVKFSLGGDRGLGIFEAGYPKAVKVTCDTGMVLDNIEETVNAGQSTLQFDPGTGRYHYVWKTDKKYKGFCYRLDVKFIDGETYSATFKF
jgi:hypothetical protein